MPEFQCPSHAYQNLDPLGHTTISQISHWVIQILDIQNPCDEIAVQFGLFLMYTDWTN